MNVNIVSFILYYKKNIIINYKMMIWDQEKKIEEKIDS